MAEPIIADNKDPANGLMEHYAAILANFKCRMTLREAEDAYSLDHGELRAAIENGLIKYFQAGKTQYRVGPMHLAEYIEKHRTIQNEPLPS